MGVFAQIVSMQAEQIVSLQPTRSHWSVWYLDGGSAKSIELVLVNKSNPNRLEEWCRVSCTSCFD